MIFNLHENRSFQEKERNYKNRQSEMKGRRKLVKDRKRGRKKREILDNIYYGRKQDGESETRG